MVRNPFDGLDGLRPVPGLVAVVCVLLGSTAYDGFSNSPFWVNLLQSGHASVEVMGTLGLLGMIALVAVTYSVATWTAGLLGTPAELRLGGPHSATAERGAAGGARVSAAPAVAGGGAGRADWTIARRQLPGLFAHSIIPIAVGYLIAHYFTLFVLEGQNALIRASDPLGTGANLFGTAERGVDARLAGQPALVATIQVLAIVIGHILGVVAAHDRAVRLFPRRQAIAGQLPLLVLMVCYTVGGLILLFAG